MTGGVSHVDSFDPKPKLFADHGKTITVDNWQGKLGEFKRYLKQPQWEFKPRGQSGIEVSELFPHVGACVDDLCVIRSMESDHTNHYEATLGMHTGSFTFARPSIGAWVSYGLGTENRNLPSFVVIAPHAPYAGAQTWGSDFLPGCHQGTQVVPGAEPIANIERRVALARAAGAGAGPAGRSCNRRHQRAAPGRSGARSPHQVVRDRLRHAARGARPCSICRGRPTPRSSSTAWSAGRPTGFGWQCLVARRLVERGVRFIELIDTGSSGNWDSHGDMNDHVAAGEERRSADRRA